MRKLLIYSLFTGLMTLAFWGNGNAQQFGGNMSAEGLWTDHGAKGMQTTGTRYIFPNKYRPMSLDFAGMKSFLATAPHENAVAIGSSMHILSLPMPEGGFEHFRIVYSPIMEAPLAAMFPEIRTYAGQGIEDPTAYIRLDATPQGFHAMVLRTGKSAVYIDPYAMGDTQLYISYLRKDFATSKVMTCDFVGNPAEEVDPQGGNNLRLFGDCIKRTYRLALSATGEYTAFHGGTLALAQAAQVTTMNRVNGVYEREFAVRLNIIANNNLIVYTNSATDPFTNGNPGTMITQNQNNTTTVIGSANYDIGHVFGTNSGGLAGLGVVCSSTNKARGVTGSGAPVGDPFDIDYVAHEMGHQFGGNHTFNSNQGACNGNQNNNTAMETGSGTTIMAYAGICGTHNVANNSDDYFHFVSLREIYAFLLAGGASCDVNPGLTNNQPVLTTLSNFTIPRSTPFVLTASATDADNDPITYCWEQYDNATNTQPPVATNTGGPQFRSRPAVTSGSRYFPRLSDLAAGTVSIWEVLPSVTRNMRFGCYVRDNHPGGGCGDNDTMTVRVLSTAGPFVVTAPNTAVTWPATSSQNVTWNVANTTAAPISCANVNIYLSTDGGLTYPITLATNVANTGTFTVTVPNNPTTTARVMVKAANNIFFDISDVNFTITAPTQDYSLLALTTTQSICAPANVVYSISVQSLGGYTGAVTMSATGVPVGGTATFSPNPVTPGNNTTMTISGTGAIAPGTYTITVSGNATSGIHSTTVTLTVTSAAPTAIVLTSPANGATGVSTAPTITWTAQTGATYSIDIATDAGFTNIVRTATGLLTASYVPAPPLNSTTLYYWRVRGSNGCGNGAYSTTRNFTTNNVTCFSPISTTVPRTISSTGTPIITDSIYVGVGGTVTDVNVTNLVGTHTWVSDLRMTLIGPTGANIVLFNGLCTDNDNFNIKFDDAGPAYNTIACPITGGLTYHPSGNLATFNGTVPTGWWKLRIEDLFDQDGGTLTAWTLNICADNACTMTASVPNNTPVSCRNGNNGTATAAPTGGGGPYTYLWSNGATTASITGLVAGAYTCTVTDAWGCLATTTVTITQPAAVLAASTTPTATSCGLANGSATASATGGTAGYTYLWSNGATTQGISNVAAGTYTVTVTDTRNCTTTATAVVAASTGVSANATSNTPASCGQSNGTATVAATGGPGGYTYLWSNGATTQTITGVAAGSYTVTVTSGSPNCFAVGTVTVASLGNVTASVTQVQQSSCGLSNGSGTASPTGGTSYTYLWSNGATTQSVSGLAAGTYTVTVTDVSTCTATATLVINASNAVFASVPTFSPTTCGQNDGSAGAIGAGGNGNFTYLWSNGATTQNISGLGAGSYTVTVTDGAGCTGTSAVTIGASTAVTANIFNFTSTSCGLSNGVASAVAQGGSGAYTYLWSDGQTTAQANGLAAGNYTVTVTDQAGCTGTAVVTINASSAPSVAIGSQVNVNCFGASTGSAVANPTGGTAPYTYLWSDGQTTATASNLAAGTYTVTVTDASNCTQTATITITEPASALSATSTVIDESNSGALDGSATATPNGGTAPYTYLWSNGQTGQTATGLAGGTYTCTVTDANGCTTVVTATVATLVAVEAGSAMGMEIYPNPSQGVFFVAFELGAAEDLTVTVYNKLGQKIWEKMVTQATSGRVEVNLGNVASGVYSVELKAGAEISTKKIVVGK
ncbi:MAG: T9SS type A sorting domain-containing protein [Bacteroidetes bacterium]|nr:T9SS type A sorting domain-containing protein [Bacteroidota bacterium]